MQLNIGWKSSCCNFCDNLECPDYGECKCFENISLTTGTEAVNKILDRYKNDDFEIETFD